jgi:hypothetical protein
MHSLPWLLLLTGTVLGQDDALKGRMAEISAFLKKARQPEEFKAAIIDLQALARDAGLVDDYDLSVSALEQAAKAAKPAKDAGLGAELQAQLEETRLLQQEFTKVRGALKTLKEKPEDPQANVAAGRYLCLVKHDWNQGVPMFKKGKDAALKGLAEAEEAVGDAAKDLAALGDQWWSFAEKNAPFRERAYHWYRQAWPGLEGIARLQLKGKFRSAGSNPKGRTSNGTPAGWAVGQVPAGQPPENLAVDEKFFHGGKASFRIGTAKQGILVTQKINVADDREYEASLWVMTEGEIPPGLVTIVCNKTDEETLLAVPLEIPADQPWWSNPKPSFKTPPGTVFIRFIFKQTLLKDGAAVWLDDVSLKSKGSPELVPNGGFETPK